MVTFPVAILYTPPMIMSGVFGSLMRLLKGGVLLSRLTCSMTFWRIVASKSPEGTAFTAGQIFWVIASVDGHLNIPGPIASFTAPQSEWPRTKTNFTPFLIEGERCAAYSALWNMSEFCWSSAGNSGGSIWGLPNVVPATRTMENLL